MQPTRFYQDHLDQVSRSFAFCIQKLDEPFRQWVSLSYLLCRVLDTVEDSPWETLALQEAQYAELIDFLNEPVRDIERDTKRVRAWTKRFSSSIPQTEIALLRDAPLLFADLHSLPVGARTVIQATVNRMQRGMHYYSRRSNGPIHLRDLTDVNRYCYFVAGVVGELLTGLYRIHHPEFDAPETFDADSLHFGLFLQKVNLLKDQRKDEREGRRLIPDREIVMQSLRENANGAFRYILSIPASDARYRTFCAWSFFLGAASLPWMQKSFEKDDASKIPREITQQLLTWIESIVADNRALQQAYDEYSHLLPIPSMKMPCASMEHLQRTTVEHEWFQRLVSPRMDSPTLSELRMI